MSEMRARILRRLRPSRKRVMSATCVSHVTRGIHVKNGRVALARD